METYIYGLVDPRNGKMRYVGKADDPIKRLRLHLNEKRHCHRVHWIQSLLRQNLKPVLVIIQSVPIYDWQEWEKYWIEMHREAGYDLVNNTDGGDGVSGLKHNLQTRKKLSDLAKQKSSDPEYRKEMSKRAKRQFENPEHKKKMLESSKKYWGNPENR